MSEANADPNAQGQVGQSDHDKQMIEKADSTIEQEVRGNQQQGTKDTLPDYIPEKFRNAEDPMKAMADSYKELESKLGKSDDDDDDKSDLEKDGPSDSDSDELKGEDESDKQTLDLQKFYDEFKDNDGKLSEDSYKELAGMGFDKSVVDTYIAGYGAQVKEVLNKAYDIVGGQENYDAMIDWAMESMSNEELATYQTQLETSPEAWDLTLRGLYSKWQDSGEANVQRVRGEGKPEVRGTKPFNSRAEVTAAMRDPRYSTDAAYREQVQARLAVSDDNAMGAVDHGGLSRSH